MTSAFLVGFKVDFLSPTSDTHGCHELAECVNRELHTNNVTHVCNCNEGYRGNGTECTDIDDCLYRSCPLEASCRNFEGVGHECICPQ